MVRRRREWSLTGVGLAALLAAVPVAEARAQAAYAVDVPAGSLESALLVLARQTEHQLFFSKELVAGRRAAALKGRFAPEDAAQRLVAGADLSVSRAGPHLLVLERKPPAPATRQPAQGVDAERPFATSGDGPGAVATAAGPETAAAPTLVDEVLVTGSNIRGARTASPVIVLDRAELERSGHATLIDALRALPANFGGGAGEGAVTTGADRQARNASYGTALNLRGLGNNATLVLINGRRMAGSGTFGDFVDVSLIPTGAVERVEVLLDGASAVYGSDAVGGVVNIILRRSFAGAETRVLGGLGTRGEPGQAQVGHTFGADWAGGSLVASLEWQRRENLPGAARDFAATSDLRALGGHDWRSTNSFPGNILVVDPVTRALVPGFAIPAGQSGLGLRPADLVAGAANRQNQRQGVDILPKQTLASLYVGARQSVGPRLELSGDIRLASRRFRAHATPAASTLTVTRANPFFVSPTGAASHQIAYSFAGDLPNPVSSGTSETLAASLGGTLTLPHTWKAEAYGVFAQVIEENRNANLINSVALNEALGTTADRADTAFSAARDGFFNPFTGVAGANNPAVAAYVGSGFLNLRNRGRVAAVNLQADGPIWDAPGGAVKLALGAQARREGLRRRGVLYVASAAPTAQVPTDVERDVVAGFAELQVPLVGPGNARPGLERLELSLAGRVEHYEGVGTTANPKVGVLWAPGGGLQLRGTYGRSFRAPALRESGDPEQYNPQMLALGGGRLLTLTLSGGNPDLKPETAQSWTVGADWRPARWPGLRLSVTGFDIRFKDRIDQPVQRNLANALSDPTLAPFITRISPATNAADLALIQGYLASPALNSLSGVFAPEAYGAIADNRYVNTARLRVRGLDLSAGYAFDLGEDRLALGASATWLLRYEQQVTSATPRLDRVNVAGFPLRFRGRATADWTRGPLTLGVAANHVNAYRDSLGARIRSHTTFDLQARLAPAEQGAFKGVSALLTVRNVFDRDPPFYDNSLGVGFDAANADPVGRFVALQLTRAW